VQASATSFCASKRSEQIVDRARDYLYLVKPRLSSMVVLSGVVGYWLGASVIGLSDLLGFTLGTFFVVGGANAFNQVIERESDGRMQRTAHRPLPTGRIQLGEAMAVAASLSLGGIGLVLVCNGVLPALLGLGALLTYVLVYTPLKARSAWSTPAGAVAGAIPPLMGYSAASGGLEPLAWCLFGLLFLWQFPHTWAIAATYREDYARVGHRALPAAAQLQTLAMTIAVVAMSFAPASLGLASRLYLIGAALLGSMLIVAAVRFGGGAVRRRAIELLAATLFYLPLVLALLALDGKVS
jgi:protoheme IX farnesyltransferase